MSPFEVVYGFNPLTPLDLSPIPQVEQVNLDGLRKGEFIKKLHEKVRENILKKTEAYKKHADKKRKEVTFEPGEWVWLHMRQERFPQKRSSKLAPRGDGPFKVLEKINDNAYRLDLPGEFNISHSFNVTDLSPYDADDPVLRTKPRQGGGDDEDIDHMTVPVQKEPDSNPIPSVHGSPMTRSKTRRLREGFNEAIQTLLSNMDVENTLGPHPLSIAPELDITEDFAKMSLKEDPPATNQGMTIYLTGNGAQNNENLPNAVPERQDMTRPSLEADRASLEQEDGSSLERGELHEDMYQLDFYTHQYVGNAEKLAPTAPEQAALTNVPNKHQARQNQVFSIYTICAGTEACLNGS